MFTLALTCLASLSLGQQAGTDFYYEFRAGKPMPLNLRLLGPEAAEHSKLDEQGLRISLPASRKQHHPVVLRPSFPIKGDFDLVGTFEILSATIPKEGYGVGVSLIVATDDKRDKFIKVSRSNRPPNESAFLSEHWSRTGENKKFYQSRSRPSQVMAGKLRLIREGEEVQCLYNEGDDLEYQLVYRAKFGTDDLHHVQFAVADSGVPGNPIDARLIDLRIRSEIRRPPNGGPVLAGGEANPPQGGEAVKPPPPPGTPDAGAGKGPSGMVYAAAGLLALVVCVGIAAWVFGRRARPSPKASPTLASPASEAAVRISCPQCGKTLKLSASSLAKKIKCPGCGSLFAANTAGKEA